MRCIKCGFYLPEDWYYSFNNSAGLISCPVCGNPVVECDNSHEYIDLGLSVKWATCNMGALAPEEPGDYYAWGEITPQHVNIDITPLELKVKIDAYGSKQLDEEKDVAHVCWKGKWRIPTRSEFQELKEECYWSWINQKGMHGYSITSKQPGYKQLFLPAVGDSFFYNAGYTGCYWTNSLLDDGKFAEVLGFNKGDMYIGKRRIHMACSIRPVRE